MATQQQGKRNGSQMPAWPAFAQLQQVSPKEFGQEVQKRLDACNEIAQTVINVVENGDLDPITGFGVIACTQGQLFSYQAYHQQPTVADVASLLGR